MRTIAQVHSIMKKHSGTALQFGILAVIFGLLLMGIVDAVSGMISGPSLPSAGTQAAGIARTASDISFSVILLGIAFLGLGIFMRSGPD